MIRALTSEELAELVAGGQDAGFGALDTEKGCLPLRSLHVDVRVDGLSAATTVRQQFVNVFAEPLEASYVFPLPPRAAVIGFRMIVDGAEIRGRIDERAQARQDYDTAVAEGRHAAIVEEERPDVFTLRVGNIPPRSTARVEFTLVAPVAVDSLEATYRFPLVVAPRYCPGEPLDGDQVGDGVVFDTDLVPDASRITPPVLLPGMKSPVRLGIAVHVAPSTIAARARAEADAFGCSLPAEGELDADANLFITVVPGQRLDRDFILRWKVAADTLATTTVQLEPDDRRPPGLGSGATVADAPGDGTFAVTIVPPVSAAVAATPRDVVFLLDRSGSMGGWQIAAARRAVARMIDSLGDADRVAVIAFDDRMEHLGDSAELVPANDLNRWKLVEWLAAIDARGGTELVPAVAAGLKLCGAARKAAAARRRVVVLVTDAQVGDEDRVLRTLAASLGDTRLFVVGIDTAVNEGLLSRLADASGGLTELVESEERLDEVMDRIHARIQTPLVSELRIEGDGVELIAESIVPARMPDLVAGLPLVVRGRCRWAGAGARVHVEGRAHGGGIWRATAVVPKQATPGLACLWARGMLRRLEDERITSESATVDDDAIEQPEEEQTAEAIESRIVALSTSFGVLCRFTALVAIDARRPDERVRRLTPRRIVQPIDAASGMARWAMCVNYSSASFPGSFDDALYCCDFGEGGGGSWNQPAADPLAAERTEAARLVARVKPRRGSLDDVKPSRVSGLLRGVLRLLRRLGKHHAAPELIETLAAAYARLFAVPTDRAALVALLDGLAVFGAEKGARVDRWWEAARGGAIP